MAGAADKGELPDAIKCTTPATGMLLFQVFHFAAPSPKQRRTPRQLAKQLGAGVEEGFF